VERDGEFTSMDAYNRLYSRIPPRQLTFDQVNDEVVAMQVQEQNVEIGHSITSPTHVLPPTRPRPLPIGVPSLEVALAALDNIQWQQTHQDDARNELEKAFTPIFTPIAAFHDESYSNFAGFNQPIEETKQEPVSLIG
jgi:hypothetical protein